MFQDKVDVHAHFIPEEYREALIAAGQDRPEPNSALGHRSAMSTAAAISAASMIRYPAMTSLLSANGPSTTRCRPSRTRTFLPSSAGRRGEPPCSTPSTTRPIANSPTRSTAFCRASAAINSRSQLSDRLTTFTLTNGDTEGNTPPTLFKPVSIAARTGLLARLGPRIVASRRLKLSGLTAGYPHPGRLPAEVVDAYYRPVFGTPQSSCAFARLTAAISNHDLAAVRPQLAQLKVPTLIVWGTGDLFFPLKWAQRLADLIPGTTEIATLDGARMHFPDYRVGEFLPHLQQHWARHRE